MADDLSGHRVALRPCFPDGRYFLYSTQNRHRPENERGIWIYDLTGKEPARRIFDRMGEPFWSNNGRQVVIGTQIGEKYEINENWRVNADGSGRTRLPIPDTDLVLDCSRDGTWLATRTIGGEPRHHGRLTLIHPDGTGACHLTDGSANDDVFFIFKISPDARTVAYVEVRTVDRIRHCRLFVVDISGKNRREIPITFEPGATVVAHWSPDGSRLALNILDTKKDNDGSIAVVDLDGSNYRKLSAPRSRWSLYICDWKTLTPDLKVGTTDDTRNIASNWRGRPLPFPILLDTTRETIKKYGIRAFPTVLLVDPDGHLVKLPPGKTAEEFLASRLEPIPIERRLARLLDRGTSINVEDSTTLADQMTYLAGVGRIKIRIDADELKAAKVDKNALVPLQLSGNLTLRAWLNHSLAPFGLTYVADWDGPKVVRRTPNNDALARPSSRQETENARLEKALEQPVAFEFQGESLRRVVLVLEEKTHEKFVLDPVARHAGTIAPEMTVSGSNDKEPLATSLKKLLAAIGMTYIVRDEAIVFMRTPR